MVGGRLRDRERSDSVYFDSDVAGSRGRREATDATLATALCLVLLSASLLAVAPAAAQQAVSIIASPNPVDVTNDNDCTFSLGHCAQITTSDKDASINFANSGNFNAGLNGIYISTSWSDRAYRDRERGRYQGSQSRHFRHGEWRRQRPVGG